MTIQSATPTSRRRYLSQTELEQYANITVTNTAEADDKISQAEEMIDAYVGPQDCFLSINLTGKATAGSANSITLQATQQDIVDNDYYLGCEVEIIGGTGAGQRNTVTASTRAGVLTVASNWSSTPDSTSFYKVYQLGRFPRREDVTFYSDTAPSTYFKQIPEEVKRAVAAQVEYFIEMGDKFFAGDQANKQSEGIGDYSYTNAQSAIGMSKLISPKAKMYLRGIISRVGRLNV